MQLTDLEKLYDAYRSNVNDSMLGVLAEQLGVSVLSLNGAGVGYDFEWQSWIFPERDETGKIIGMLRRTHSGKKFTVPGSKRGLSYIYNPAAVMGVAAYQPGRHNWVKASSKYPCPLCGKEDWCLLSAENPANPPAVICGRTPGGEQQRECGYLHILRPEGDKRQASSVLLDTDSPVVLVEGASDVCAAFDIGFVAIGRPNDQGGLKLLTKMPIANKPIVVIGENDAGAGVRGMEATFASLRRITGQLAKLLPISGIKDLRAWVKAGLTHDGLIQAIQEGSDNRPGLTVFEDDAPATIARRWIQDEQTVDGLPKLRLYRGSWLEYVDGAYQEVEDSVFRGRLYAYLEGKLFNKEEPNGSVKVMPLRATRAKVNDIIDAMNQYCPVMVDPPGWLDGRASPEPRDLIPFTNGLLDAEAYCNGEIVFHPLTPAYFSMCRLEYPFDDKARCPLWERFLRDITNDDGEVIDLLQEWFGYNLVSDMTQERLLLMIGRRRSGKGTTLDTLQAMLGGHYCGVTTLQSLSGPFGLQPLLGKLSVVISDVRTPERREAESGLEKILAITGGDPVTINRKHKEQLSLSKLVCRFTLAGNEIPNLTDHSRALEARTSLIHLPNSYVGREDRGLKARLCEEARRGAIVPWALEGLKRLRKNGRFTMPESSSDLQSQFRRSISPLTEFIEEYCYLIDVDELERETPQKMRRKAFESKDIVYQAYTTWCENRGLYPMWREKFCAAIQRELPQVGSVRIMENGKRLYAFVGLRLNRWAFSELLNLPNGAGDLPDESDNDE